MPSSAPLVSANAMRTATELRESKTLTVGSFMLVRNGAARCTLIDVMQLYIRCGSCGGTLRVPPAQCDNSPPMYDVFVRLARRADPDATPGNLFGSDSHHGGDRPGCNERRIPGHDCR